MSDNQVEWSKKRDELVAAVKKLGFPNKLGEQIAKQLGSPKAMDRMLLPALKPSGAQGSALRTCKGTRPLDPI